MSAPCRGSVVRSKLPQPGQIAKHHRCLRDLPQLRRLKEKSLQTQRISGAQLTLRPTHEATISQPLAGFLLLVNSIQAQEDHHQRVCKAHSNGKSQDR